MRTGRSTFVPVALGLILALALPMTALGVITEGGCTATGSSTSSGSIDLTTATEWHMQSTDTAGGSGTAPSEQTSAQVAAYALGIGIPIVSESGDGDTSGSVDGVSVATYAILGARFTVGGSSSGPDGGCSGHVTVILDDVNPFLTVLGGGGALLALIGLIGIVLLARRAPSCLGRLVGMILGLFFGGGGALCLEQFGVVDPLTYVGLVIAVVGIAIGGVAPGLLAGGAASGGPAPGPGAHEGGTAA